jgi:hypothetical protein
VLAALLARPTAETRRQVGLPRPEGAGLHRQLEGIVTAKARQRAEARERRWAGRVPIAGGALAEGGRI